MAQRSLVRTSRVFALAVWLFVGINGTASRADDLADTVATGLSHGQSVADAAKAISDAIGEYKVLRKDGLFKNLRAVTGVLGNLGAGFQALSVILELSGVVTSSEDRILQAVEQVEHKVDMGRQENRAYYEGLRQQAEVTTLLGNIAENDLETAENGIARYQTNFNTSAALLRDHTPAQMESIAGAAKIACVGSSTGLPSVLQSVANANQSLEPMLKMGIALEDIIDRAGEAAFALDLIEKGGEFRAGTLEIAGKSNPTEQDLEQLIADDVKVFKDLQSQCDQTLLATIKKLQTDAQTIAWAGKVIKDREVADSVSDPSAKQLVEWLTDHFSYLNWTAIRYVRDNMIATDNNFYFPQSPRVFQLRNGAEPVAGSGDRRGDAIAWLTFLPRVSEDSPDQTWFQKSGKLMQFSDAAGESCDTYALRVHWHRKLSPRIAYYWNLSASSDEHDIDSADLSTSDLVNGLSACRAGAETWWMWLNESTANGPIRGASEFAASPQLLFPLGRVLYEHGDNYDTLVVLPPNRDQQIDLTISPNPAVAGSPVTLTSKVTKVANPTGIVTFWYGSDYLHGTTIGNGSLLSGTASVVTSSLGSGVYTVWASHAGNGSYYSKSSPPGTLTVNGR